MRAAMIRSGQIHKNCNCLRLLTAFALTVPISIAGSAWGDEFNSNSSSYDQIGAEMAAVDRRCDEERSAIGQREVLLAREMTEESNACGLDQSCKIPINRRYQNQIQALIKEQAAIDERCRAEKARISKNASGKLLRGRIEQNDHRSASPSTEPGGGVNNSGATATGSSTSGGPEKVSGSTAEGRLTASPTGGSTSTINGSAQMIDGRSNGMSSSDDSSQSSRAQGTANRSDGGGGSSPVGGPTRSGLSGTPTARNPCSSVPPDVQSELMTAARRLDRVITKWQDRSLIAGDHFFVSMGQAVEDNLEFLAQPPGVPLQQNVQAVMQAGQAIVQYLVNDNAQNHAMLYKAAQKAVEAFKRDPARTFGYDWALRFENAAKEMMMAGDLKPLIGYEALGTDAALSIPTPDHYLPLLYVLGAGQQGDQIGFPVEGVDGGSISMLAVQVG